MLIVPIEQEIEQERKIIKGFTLRQVASFGLAVAIFGGVYTYTKDIDFTINSTMIPVVLILMVGWIELQGMKAEDILKKILNVIIYRNNKRRYRTRNKYFDIFNKKYQELRNKDMNNKKAARISKKQQKAVVKAKKQSKVKPLP